MEESAVRQAVEEITKNNQIIRGDDYQNAVRASKILLANDIADIAEDMGDDYSEFLATDDVIELIEDILNSGEYDRIDSELAELIQDKVTDKVDAIRYSELDENKKDKENKEDKKKVEDKEDKEDNVIRDNSKLITQETIDAVNKVLKEEIREDFDLDKDWFITRDNEGNEYIDIPLNSDIDKLTTDKIDELVDKLNEVNKDIKFEYVWYDGVYDCISAEVKKNKEKEEEAKKKELDTEKLKEEIIKAIEKELGTGKYDLSVEDMKDNTIVNVEKIDKKEYKVEVRIELDIAELSELEEVLNPIVEKIDKEAYFDIEDSGIAIVYIHI